MVWAEAVKAVLAARKVDVNFIVPSTLRLVILWNERELLAREKSHALA